MHTMFAVPFQVHWCCWVGSFWKYRFPSRTCFFVRIRKTLRGVWQVPGIWGKGGLGWAVTCIAWEQIKTRSLSRRLQLVSQILAVGKEARNQNSKNLLWLPGPWEKKSELFILKGPAYPTKHLIIWANLAFFQILWRANFFTFRASAHSVSSAWMAPGVSSMTGFSSPFQVTVSSLQLGFS